ncbi:hypothetical protein AOLI_G00307190 [Acnodon oligacanthus]
MNIWAATAAGGGVFSGAAAGARMNKQPGFCVPVRSLSAARMSHDEATARRRPPSLGGRAALQAGRPQRLRNVISPAGINTRADVRALIKRKGVCDEKGREGPQAGPELCGDAGSQG